MKKLLLTVIATVMMAGSISAQNVAREFVLMEVFTGIKCPACPAAAAGIAMMVEEGLQVAPLAFHNSSYSPKEYATVETNRRATDYGVQGFPTVIIDGDVKNIPSVGGPSYYASNSYNTLKALYEQKIKVTSPYKIELTSSYQGEGKYNVKVVVTKVGECNGDNVRLYLALTESHVPQEWQGLPELNAVVRDVITSMAGEEITEDTFTYETTIDFDFKKMNRRNCELVAWVQNIGQVGSDVYQAVKTSIVPESVKHDIQIVNMENVPTALCSGRIQPLFTVRNQGSETITSLTFKVTSDDGEELFLHKWNGKLLSGTKIDIELPEFAITGHSNVKIEVVDLNDGSIDEMLEDNVINYEAKIPVTVPNDGELSFLVGTSEPQNVSIEVYNVTKQESVKTITFAKDQANKLITEKCQLTEKGCYRVTIKNSKGNGIGTSSNSSWAIYDSSNKDIYKYDSDDAFRYEYNIELTYGDDVAVEDVTTENIEVYPNPAKSVVNVSATNLDKVTVFNSIGQVVYTEVVASDNVMIDVESWTNGLYYINMETKDGQTSSRKVIVNK